MVKIVVKIILEIVNIRLCPFAQRNGDCIFLATAQVGNSYLIIRPLH